MPEPFLTLSPEERGEILTAGAVRLGRDPAVLEKDVWVCWALHELFRISNRPRMVFKGGTSLSKVFNVIHRFSEDVDITIDFRDLKVDFDPFAGGVSKSALKRFSEELKDCLRQYSLGTVKPHLEAALASEIGKGRGAVRASDDGENIWVDYPAALTAPGGYLPNSVLIELGGRNISEPNATYHLRPDLSEISSDLIFPEAQAVVLAPERTFWEKATLIHVECKRREVKNRGDRLSRHWSDLANLAHHDIGQRALANRGLLADVVKHKEVFFWASYADYQACLNRGLRLVPNEPLFSALKEDFKKMVDSGMFFGDKPDFADIISSLTALERKINAS